MNNTKHTPGPWHLEYDVDGIPLTIIGADNSAIGIVETWNAYTEGNRHLLTAAPAMYEALKEALDTIAHMRHYYAGNKLSVEDIQKIVDDGRAALAQADGKHV